MNEEYRFVYRFKYTNDYETRKYQIYATKPLPRGLDPQTLVDWPNPVFEYEESEHVQGIIRISDFFDNVKKLPGYSDIEYSRIKRAPGDRLRLVRQTPIELSTYYPDQIRGKQWSSDKFVTDPKGTLRAMAATMIKEQQKEFKYTYRFICTSYEDTNRVQLYGNKPMPTNIYPEDLVDWSQSTFHILYAETEAPKFADSVRRNIPGYEDFELVETPNVPKDKLVAGHAYPIDLVLPFG